MNVQLKRMLVRYACLFESPVNDALYVKLTLIVCRC